MSERFLPGAGPAKRRQLQALREHLHEVLVQVAWLQGSDAEQPRRLVGMGGTVRNLAVAAQRAAGLPSNGVQGMVIEQAALAELIERLASLPAAERASVAGIKPARADLILAGAMVVESVLEAAGDEFGAKASAVLKMEKGRNPIEVIYTSPERGDAWVRVLWTSREFPPEPVNPREP